MKNIIVPTDFSENAKDALIFAIRIANEFGSKIHLINCVNTLTSTGIYTDVDNLLKKAEGNRLNKMIEEVSGHIKKPASIRALALKGEVVSTIHIYTQVSDADLIVMGTKGASGLREILLGTNTQGVIRQIDVPTLVVPADGQTRKLDKIALAIDNQALGSESILQPFIKLSKAFASQTILFHANSQNEEKDIDPSIYEFLKDLEYSKYIHYGSDKNAGKSIRDFVEEEDIGLLTLVRRHRNFVDRIFHKSITNKEVFHSKVPLLVLHD